MAEFGDLYCIFSKPRVNRGDQHDPKDGSEGTNTLVLLIEEQVI